jgi:chemotaxis protein MotB
MNVHRSAPPVSRDRWLISYADFMTLLCAFFTALFATTQAGAPEPAAPVPVEAAAPAAPPEPSAAAKAEALRIRVEQDLAPELAAGYLQLVEDPRGLVIEIPEAGAFDVGQAELSADAAAMLQRIAGVLAALPNGVRVEGHTDDRPIRTARYGSNWELSTARATRVVEFLITDGAVPPARLSAAGYSEFRPRGDNATATGRTRNRRVDIVLLNEATERAEEPAAGARP